MTKYIITACLSLVLWNIYGQSDGNFNFWVESHVQYYVDDEVTGDFTEEDRFRSNNYFNVDYAIKGFTFGLQLEGYAPQHLLNFSPNFDKDINLGLYYARYKGKKFNVSLGHFYEQYGNGLILRSWEDRQLGLNNALMGINALYNISDKTRLSVMAGKQRIGFKLSDGLLTGVNLEHDVNNFLKHENYSANFGLSYVGRYETPNNVSSDFEPWTHALSGRYQLIFDNFYTGAEYALKTKDVLVENQTIIEDKSFYGNAFQLNMGYSQKGLAMNATFRRLENMKFYTDRLQTGNTYNESIVNYLPALTRQHDYSLSNIYVYQAQPALQFSPLEKAGEIGGQFDIFYKIKKKTALGGKYGTKLSFNASTWHGLGADYIPDYKRVDVGFLDFGEHYFSDFSLEIRKKFSRKLSGIFTAIHTDYNKKYIEESSGKIHANIFIAESTLKLKSLSSLRLEVSHLSTKQDKKNWAGSTLEWNINSNFSVFATDIYNYGNDDPNHRDHYYLVGGSYSKNKTRIALNYGRQRGGVLCVGGVCREVPAATGLTIDLTTSF